MKEFLGKLKEKLSQTSVFALIPIYITKIIIIPNSIIDASVMFALVTYLLGIKLLDLIDDGKKRYFDTKEKIVSENEFRNKVNQDMSTLLSEVNIMKMKVNNPFEKLNRK